MPATAPAPAAAPPPALAPALPLVPALRLVPALSPSPARPPSSVAVAAVPPPVAVPPPAAVSPAAVQPTRCSGRALMGAVAALFGNAQRSPVVGSPAPPSLTNAEIRAALLTRGISVGEGKEARTALHYATAALRKQGALFSSQCLLDCNTAVHATTQAAADAGAAARRAAYPRVLDTDAARRTAILSFFAAPAPLLDATTDEVIARLQEAHFLGSTTAQSVAVTLKGLTDEGRLVSTPCPMGKKNKALVYAPTPAAADAGARRRLAAFDAAAATAGSPGAVTRAAILGLFRGPRPALVDATSAEVSATLRKRGKPANPGSVLADSLAALCKRNELCRSAATVEGRTHVYALTQAGADAGAARRSAARIA